MKMVPKLFFLLAAPADPPPRPRRHSTRCPLVNRPGTAHLARSRLVTCTSNVFRERRRATICCRWTCRPETIELTCKTFGHTVSRCSPSRLPPSPCATTVGGGGGVFLPSQIGRGPGSHLAQVTHVRRATSVSPMPFVAGRRGSTPRRARRLVGGVGGVWRGRKRER